MSDACMFCYSADSKACIAEGRKKQRTSGIPLMTTRHTRFCLNKYTEKLKIYDSQGCFHIAIIQFCHCEGETKSVTLVKLHLWSLNAKKPTAAFHIDLLKLLHSLSMECKVAVKRSTEALKHLHVYPFLSSADDQQDILCLIGPQKKERIVSLDDNFAEEQECFRESRDWLSRYTKDLLKYYTLRVDQRLVSVEVSHHFVRWPENSTLLQENAKS
ncbi:hypothetical protein CAPTEDRAFT_186980 [Capitella teleta]|uniref:CxC2-like cysteine cluster KDZ transposase-associated domain-containing protein n=1 Tax=Capitella teleta TaxID=283909 RepID=R7VJ08_CAPTE|nr:hypothetical protein CAPTEDRAFT_186980 [Capitella teleta]|eukprot:ELU18547.1 hypothetical protein CAPTEDRAFT_186980 [Capitella teleta]